MIRDTLKYLIQIYQKLAFNSDYDYNINEHMMRILLIIMFVICMPLSSMAMKAMDEKAMEEVTGQSGVSIFVDVTMSLHIKTLAWGDSDGLGNAWSIESSGGYAGTSGSSLSGLSLMSISSKSVSFWPAASSINIMNGVPSALSGSSLRNP